MKVLVVSIHPDDFCLCVGGTVALHGRRGDEVTVLVLSDGERGGDPDIRRKETISSAKILGTGPVEFLGLPDGEVEDSIGSVSKIEEVVDEVGPDRIYCCSSKDRHQDHRKGSLATLSAARMVNQVFLYEGMSAWTSFEPSTFIDISGVIELKMESIAAHKSQEDRYYMRPSSVKGQNQFRGWQAHVTYAEAFEVSRQVIDLSG
jgi:LmbE family N-acetylglucosaminyl deacetylase